MGGNPSGLHHKLAALGLSSTMSMFYVKCKFRKAPDNPSLLLRDLSQGAWWTQAVELLSPEEHIHLFRPYPWFQLLILIFAPLGLRGISFNYYL